MDSQALDPQVAAAVGGGSATCRRVPAFGADGLLL